MCETHDGAAAPTSRGHESAGAHMRATYAHIYIDEGEERCLRRRGKYNNSTRAFETHPQSEDVFKVSFLFLYASFLFLYACELLIHETASSL